jgi:hypothetical protein
VTTVAPTEAPSRGSAKSPSQLAQIELRNASDVHNYAEAGRAISRAMSIELATAAHVLLRKLGRKGWGLEATQARLAARRATRHLRRAAECQAAAGDHMAAFWRDFSNTYGELMSNARVKKEFDYTK